jgi:hypothetical protein
MTDLETYVPLSALAGRPIRPVRRFVIAQVVLAVLFGALWWSGLAAPRLSLGNTSSGSYDHLSGRVTTDLVLHNNAPLAVKVRRVTAGDRRVTVSSVRIDGVDIASTGQRVAGRGQANLVIEFTCGRVEGGGQPPALSTPSVPIKLEIAVRTPVGLERTRTTRTVDLPITCFG